MKNLFLLLFCVLLNSCLKMPEHESEPVLVTYSFDVGKDMSKLFDFTATYQNPDKQMINEPISSLPWSKQIKASTPFNAQFIVDFVAKTDIPNQEIYQVGFSGNINHSEIIESSSFLTKSIPDANKLRFAINIPSYISAEDVNLIIAPLKYDKHFAFTFTVDDSNENAWSRIFPLIHKKWIDDKEFFHMGCTPTTGYIPSNTLAMTDGCGNERRFGYGVAIWPTLRDNFHPNGRIVDSSTLTTNVYITWEELRTMLDFGCSVHFHNIDETKYDIKDQAQLFQGLQDDYDKVVEKLGWKMKTLALPDGELLYLEAGRKFPKIEFIRSSLSSDLIWLKSCGSLYKCETYGGKRTSQIPDKLAEIANQAASDNPYWVGLTVHRPQNDYMDMLTEIYRLYGAKGNDNVWVASWDEIYEYQELRNEAILSKIVDGQKVTFEIILPDHPQFSFKDLSFLVDGIGNDCSVTPLSDNIYGFSYAPKGNNLLINMNFDPKLPKLAEKYIEKYEISGKETDRDDAMYFVSMLLPELATPLLSRINQIDNTLMISDFVVNGGNDVVYDRQIKIQLKTSKKPTKYRIGETSDLSTVPWQAYQSVIQYTIGADFGNKTIYVQVEDDKSTSKVVSKVISYADVPARGTISRNAIHVYLKKYDKYKVKVNKKIVSTK